MTLSLDTTHLIDYWLGQGLTHDFSGWQLSVKKGKTTSQRRAYTAEGTEEREKGEPRSLERRRMKRDEVGEEGKWEEGM